MEQSLSMESSMTRILSVLSGIGLCSISGTAVHAQSAVSAQTEASSIETSQSTSPEDVAEEQEDAHDDNSLNKDTPEKPKVASILISGADETNPLLDLFPKTEFVDIHGVDLASGKLRLHEKLISSKSDQLGVDLNLTSPGLMPYRQNSDYIGEMIYQGLTSNSVLGTPDPIGQLYVFGYVNGLAVDFVSHTQSEKFWFKNNSNPGWSPLSWDYIGSYGGSSANLVTNPNVNEIVYNGKDGTIAKLSRNINIKLSLSTAFGDGIYSLDFAAWGATTTLTRSDGEVWTYRYNTAQHNGVNINRIKSIVSNRGYALQFSYENDDTYLSNDLQKDKWYSTTRISRYNKSYVYCDESTFLNCANLAGNSDFVDMTYDRQNYIVEIKKSNGESRRIWFERSIGDQSYRIKALDKGGLIATKKQFSYFEYADTECGFRTHTVSQVLFVGQTWKYYDRQIFCGDSLRYISRKDPAEIETSVETGAKIGSTYLPPLSYSVGGQLQSFQYQLPYYLTKQWLPDNYIGNPPTVSTLEFSYDDRGNRIEAKRNPKAGFSASPIVWKASYAPTCTNQMICNKPLSITDPRGYVTSFAYDPAHGGILTETLPAVTNEVGAAIAPVKRHEYAQRYAWVTNGAGGYIRAATPIYVLTADKTCRTSATVGSSCAGGAADEVVTTYDYGPDAGPNTLLLRGMVVTAGGVSLRTCYGYDRQGRKISETSPRADLTVCP
jgi:hypothetical protein